MLGAKQSEGYMWKVHLVNREPPKPFWFLGRLIESHVIPETEPLRVVPTQEQAQEVIRELIAQGRGASDLYAVGFDLPMPIDA
jgi:hypothetical protein